MMKLELLNKLKSVERIANYSKLTRFLNNPLKYIHAMYIREIVYPKTRKEKIVSSKLFYGASFKVALPASTDIYLTGGKSHSSEIRLAKFLINNLENSDHFLDIGAHFGYFTLIASVLVGEKGRVIAFEPSIKNFDLLKQNIGNSKNIQVEKTAVSNSIRDIDFYEFPNLYSEFNTLDITQFENENWYRNSIPTKITVSATTLDNIIKDNLLNPRIVKIDVEGAEFDVLSGGIQFFTNSSPLIVMEYLEPKRKNASHIKALELLISLQYEVFIIDGQGLLKPISAIHQYLEENRLESDNIVFKKKAN